MGLVVRVPELVAVSQGNLVHSQQQTTHVVIEGSPHMKMCVHDALFKKRKACGCRADPGGRYDREAPVPTC